MVPEAQSAEGGQMGVWQNLRNNQQLRCHYRGEPACQLLIRCRARDKMPKLIVRKRLHSHSFGVWKWTEADHKEPLQFQLDGAVARIYVEPDRIRKDEPLRDLQFAMYLQFELIFDGAPQEYITALLSHGSKTTQFANRIYDYFVETLYRFEGVLRVSGKVRHLMSFGAPSIHSFYDTFGLGWREEVTWQVDDQDPQVFRPPLGKQPRGKNPLFKHPQLITSDKWKRMQRDINANRLPSEEILELHRLAGKLYPKEKRIPIVEAAILIESKLKAYAETILPDKGFTKSKIKDLRDELTFNSVLNLVLPLTLSKTDLKRIRKWRPHIDRIRKLRNDIVHNDLTDEAISEKEVLDGINAAVGLFEFIEDKLKRR